MGNTKRWKKDNLGEFFLLELPFSSNMLNSAGLHIPDTQEAEQPSSVCDVSVIYQPWCLS